MPLSACRRSLSHDSFTTATADAKRAGAAHDARSTRTRSGDARSTDARPAGPGNDCTACDAAAAGADGDAGPGASAIRTAGDGRAAGATDAAASPARTRAERADAKSAGDVLTWRNSTQPRATRFRRASSDCQDHANIRCRTNPTLAMRRHARQPKFIKARCHALPKPRSTRRRIEF